MLCDISSRNTLHSAHCDIVMRSQTVHIPGLTGPVTALYTIDDQCRIELIGQHGTDPGGTPRWLYAVTMPVVCLTEHAAARTEVRFTALISAPYSEEKLRWGCLLQADCLVCPHSAVQVAKDAYRITYDAHISLYLSCHACCS